jgi:hypothetical protein
VYVGCEDRKDHNHVAFHPVDCKPASGLVMDGWDDKNWEIHLPFAIKEETNA